MHEPKIAELRSVDLGVTNLESCLEFYQRVWNLDHTGESGGIHYLRATGRYRHVLSLRRTERPSIVRVVFGARDREAVDALHRRAREAGHVTSDLRVLDWPGGGYGFGLQDPEGRNYAVVSDVEDFPTLADAPDRPRKLSHVNLNSGAPGPSGEALKLLGFRVIDVTPKMTFFRCNNDHHSMVVGFQGGPTLNHIAFEMPEIDSLMRGVGRMRDHGYPIDWGPGRHGPGNNAFAYFTGPEEIPLEYTCEMQQVDDTYVTRPQEEWRWPPGRVDHWGLMAGPTARMARVQTLFRFTPDGYDL